MNKINILVCCHKECELPKNDIYLPIHVGRAISKINLDIQPDDLMEGKSCDNISDLNGIFCEMTALYWAWKNLYTRGADVEYIGLCHYRRYFDADKHWLKRSFMNGAKKTESIVRIMLGRPQGISAYEQRTIIKSLADKRFEDSNERLAKLIPNYEMLYSSPVKCFNTDMNTFFSTIGNPYLVLMKEIIANEYGEYLDVYERVMSGSRLYAANMVILKVRCFDEYCTFVFGVLMRHLELVKERGICTSPEKEKIYARISGYLAEILTSTFIEQNKTKLRTRELGKFFVDC